MFDLEKAIETWRQQFTAEEVGRAATLDELESHLREDVERLVAVGLPEEQAFQKAVAELGDPAEVAREFARAWPMGAYHLSVTTLAAWFILNGAGNLLGESRLVFRGHNVFSYWDILSILLGSVQLAMGIGLLRRKRFWRVLAMSWCLWFCAASLVWFLVPALRYAPPAHDPRVVVRYGVLGLGVPYDVFNVFQFLNAAMWMFGLCLLMAPRSRNYFSAARA